MLFALLALPLALLCLFLAVLTWRRRLMRHTLVLALLGMFFLAFGISMVILTYYGYLQLQLVNFYA